MLIEMADNRVTIYMTLFLLLYFLWMDIALFHQVHTKAMNHHNLFQGKNQEVTEPNSGHPFLQTISPFTGLSVKMMMLDQVNNYIHTPSAHLFSEVTHFSTVFYFITPNMVSFIGLLFAIGAAKCIAIDSRPFHYLAIALFQMRTWMDALDGIVARSRLGMVQHMSIRNTTGYVVDGVADSLGFAAFLIGCFQFLRRAVPKQRAYLPLKTSEVFGKDSNSSSGSCKGHHPLAPSSWSQRRVFFVVLSFGLQLALSAFLWDHYINAYHTLLETQPSSYSQAVAQGEILKSAITWVLMWFWRISNAHTFIQLLLYAIYIDRMWEFLVWIRFVGFVQILTLSFFTEIHITTIRNYLIQAA